MLTKLRKPFTLLISQTHKSFASNIPQSASNSNITKRDKLQFSKNRLTDWGELPAGEIPDALKYDRPFEISKLSNGVRVGTESWNSPLATVTLAVKAGTRNETLDTSGVSQFIKNLSKRGTNSKSRAQIEKELDTLGGNFNVEVGRETTFFSLTVLPEHANKAAELLSDMVMNPLLNKNQIEAEKDEIYRNACQNHKDQMYATLENAHYTSYRDHYIGQPLLGIRENVSSITADAIKQFHHDNYVASNVVLIGAGNIKHQEFADVANKALGNLNSATPAQKNSERPFFTPSTLYIRDDEMANINIVVFFNAPTWKDPEFFAMFLIQKLLGEYQANKFTGAHLNSAKRQYNTLHSMLGSYPDVTLHKCLYFPYQDTAIFGSYLYGNEIFGHQMLYISQSILTEYASYLNHAEFFRARNAVYNDLLTTENSADVAKDFSNQLIYLNRRIPRSEFARRLSHMDTQFISNIITKWFWDSDLSAVAWGPLHDMMAFSHYNRPLRRSTLGWYGNSHIWVF